jgi:hypothetical protein
MSEVSEGAEPWIRSFDQNFIIDTIQVHLLRSEMWRLQALGALKHLI